MGRATRQGGLTMGPKARFLLFGGLWLVCLALAIVSAR